MIPLRRPARAARALVATTVTAVVVLVATAAPAAAHAGQVVATDYLARITNRGGLDIRIVEAGGRVELTNRSAAELTVLGYENEPYLRVGRNGVFRNQRSPATYLNATRSGGQQPPPEATADATPRWVRIGDGPTTRWHDHRLHWMGAPPPAIGASPHQRHLVARWAIPVRISGGTVDVEGEIVYVPGPPVWPWVVTAVVLAGAVVLAVGRSRPRAVLVGSLAVLVAADVIRVAGLALIVAGGAGAQLRQAVDVGTVDFVGWGLAVAAVVRLLGRRPDGRVAAGVAGLLLGIVGGLLEWGDLGRSQPAVATPHVVARACIVAVTALGFGLAAAVLRDTGRRRVT